MNTPIISLIYCIRGGHIYLERSIQSLVDKCANKKNIEVLLKIDTDEDKTPYDSILSKTGLDYQIVVSDRQSGYYDLYLFFIDLCQRARGEIMWFVADDLVILGKDWDEELKKALAIFDDKIFALIGLYRSKKSTSKGYKSPMISKELFNCCEYISPTQQLDRYLRELIMPMGRFLYTNTIDFTFVKNARRARRGRVWQPSTKQWEYDIDGHRQKIYSRMKSQNQIIFPPGFRLYQKNVLLNSI